MISTKNHIKEALFQHDCVVLPNFGGFIVNYKSAEIQERYILPPYRWLAFNELLKTDDGILSSFISQKENISRQEALIQIKDFATFVKNEIKIHQSYQLDDIGVFTINQEDRLQFIPDKQTNFYTESYGLEKIYFSFKETKNIPVQDNPIHHPVVLPLHNPVILQPQVDAIVIPSHEETFEALPNYNTPEKRRFSKKYMLYALMIGFLLLGINLYFHDNKNTETSSMLPADLPYVPKKELLAKAKAINEEIKSKLANQESESVIANNTPTDFKSEEIKVKPVAKPATEIVKTKQNKKFYLIAGSFGLKTNAKILQNRLKSEGYNSEVIFSRQSNSYKVSVAAYDVEAEAQQDMIEKRAILGGNIWVLKQ